jgi:hypothetical protein
VQRVRMLAEQNNQLDSTAIVKSTRILEQEIHNLKNMYEQELNKLRSVSNMGEKRINYQ